MPPPQQSQQTGLFQDAAASFGFLCFIADVLTALIRPITRTRQGRRAMGGDGLAAALFILCYAEFTHSFLVAKFFWFWLLMVIVRRITASRREHTEFQGDVWLFSRFVGDEMHARLLEAVAVWAAGFVVGFVSAPAGKLLTWCAIACAFRCGIERVALLRMQDAAHDARIEMDVTARRFEQSRRG